MGAELNLPKKSNEGGDRRGKGRRGATGRMERGVKNTTRTRTRGYKIDDKQAQAAQGRYDTTAARYTRART